MRNFVSYLSPSKSKTDVRLFSPSLRTRQYDWRALLTISGFVGFLEFNFVTGPGLTGWIMWLALGIMVWFAMEKRRRAHFERYVRLPS